MKTVSFFVVVLAILLYSTAHAAIDWFGVPDLSEADKTDIARLALDLNMDGATTASVRPRYPSSDKLYVISSQVGVSGLRRVWREIYICRTSEESCPDNGASRGDWSQAMDSARQERWRIADGDWFVDVELGSAISYAEAEMIALAIHRNTLVISPEVAKYRNGFNSSGINAIHTLDPIAREFRVEIGGGGSGESVSVRLQDGEVQVYEFGVWRA